MRRRLLRALGEETTLWSPSLDQMRPATEVLEDKVVLLFFGASWCPRE